jgi:hypothetical protein
MEKVKKALRKYLLEQVEKGKISPFCAIYLEKIAIKSIEIESTFNYKIL